jgi:hypothetical protein
MIKVSLGAEARLSRTDAVQKLPGYPTKSTFIGGPSFRTHGARRMASLTSCTDNIGCVPPFTRSVLRREIGLALGQALRPLVQDYP